MRLLPSGSAGLLIEVDDLAAVMALTEQLRTDPVHGVVDVVPAARTVLLVLDPDLTDPAKVAAEVHEFPRDHALLPPTTPRDHALLPGRDPTETVRIPVHYDGDDLAAVAELLGCDEAEVVRRHTSALWLVAFSGFAPGFGYAVPTDQAGWGIPRRADPRTRVPAGSVGLAGDYTGVYPRASPGGWQLIGRTEVSMFDPDRDPPAILRPGVGVRFVDVDGQP